MKKILLASFIILTVLGFQNRAAAQCTGTPIVSFVLTGTTNVSCFNGNDGSITTTLTGGQAPFTYSLVYATGGGDIPISQISNTNSQVAVFTGLFANDFLASFLGPGNYRVDVITTNGTMGIPPLGFCNARQVPNIILTQPTELQLTGSDVALTCFNDNNGSGVITASGGTAPYTFAPVDNGTGATIGTTATTVTFSGASAGSIEVTVTDDNGCQDVITINVTEPPQLVINSVNVTNETCTTGNDGQITVNASGGSGALTYTLNPGGVVNNTGVFSGLSAGIYTVDVDDAAGCGPVASGNINVILPDVEIAIDSNTPNTRCLNPFNGAISITPSGGTAPYSYAWTGPNGFNSALEDLTGLEPGAYTLTLTDPVSGCTDVEVINVADNPPTVSITVDGVTDNTRCIPAYNGAINVTVSGATQFAWTGPNGFTASTADIASLEPGAYTLTATDPVSGCNDVQIVNVGDNPPTVSITVDGVLDNTRCIPAYNGAINVTVAGATQFAWTGPNGFTASTADIAALEPGAYTLTATDAVSGCNDVQIVNVGDNPPTVSITVDGVTDNTRCIPAYNGAINVTVSGATQFAWTGPNGFTAATADIAALEPGAYTLTATDPVSGCNDIQIVNVGDNPPTVSITVDGVTDNTRCIPAYNGAINVTVTGATQFAWTGPNGFTAATADISALEPGAYTLTATDPVSGCNAVQIVNVGDNPPAVSITVDGVTDNTRCIPAY
ncbi:MAG TPA: SprB repeat-containing protein, partial [Chryseosolibacter sp.]